MKALKLVAVLGVFALALCQQVGAESSLESYIEKTDPLLIQFKRALTTFVEEIKPLREASDIVGIKALADKNVKEFESLLVELDGVEPPAVAQSYHRAFRRLLEVRRDNDKLIAETLAQQIALILKVQKLKESGASEQEVDAYIQQHRYDSEAFGIKAKALKDEAAAADRALKAEREKFVEQSE